MSDEKGHDRNLRGGWRGFDGRRFLTDAEYEAYCRRMPVRYAARNMGPKPEVCRVCGQPETRVNPFQAAHRVPFNAGILQYRLTPDWLDSRENLVWVHRRVCNKRVEMSAAQIEAEVSWKLFRELEYKELIKLGVEKVERFRTAEVGK